ncbi:MAG: hypothetical protein WB621_20570 [Candidatus Acidiferrales bacterium]
MLRREIPFGRIGEVASTDKSIIWPSDVSSYYGGRDIAPDKAQRIREAAVKLIDLHDSVVVTPNWRSPVAVRVALAKLAEIRRDPATAPWQRIGTGAVASPEDSTSAVVIAGNTLAGPSSE